MRSPSKRRYSPEVAEKRRQDVARRMRGDAEFAIQEARLRTKIEPRSVPTHWHCSNAKHATYEDEEKFVQHLLKVHNLDLARDGKRYSY